MASDQHAAIKVFNDALAIIDRTEPVIRNMIENDLMDVAGLNGSKVKGTVAAGHALAQKIAVVRAKAIKQAFRHIRDNLSSGI